MNTTSELDKIEDAFLKVEQERCAAQETFEQLLTAISAALSARDIPRLINLIPYVTEGDGIVACHHIGKTYRIVHVLKIIAAEYQHHLRLFSDDCCSAEALWEKYILTLFAFRRLRLRLSDRSLSEAIIYLQEHPVSYLAAYMIDQNELLIPDSVYYETLALVFEKIWGASDLERFTALYSEGGTHEPE